MAMRMIGLGRAGDQIRGRALVATVLVTWLLFCIPGTLVGQTPGTLIGKATAMVEGSVLTLDQLRVALAALEADVEVGEAVKVVLRSKYQGAVDSLKRAAANQVKEALYRDAVKTGPTQEEEWKTRLEALPSVEAAARVLPTGDAEAVGEETDRQLAELGAQKEDLKAATSELARVKGRPVEISASLPGAHRDLSTIQAQLESPKYSDEASSPEEEVDCRVLLAARQEVQSVLVMLKQEQLAQTAREGLLQAQIDLLIREVENGEAGLASLRGLLRQRLAREVAQVASQAETMHGSLQDGDELTRGLAQEAQALAKEFELLIDQVNEVIGKRGAITKRVDRLVNSYDLLKEQLKMSGGGVAMAQVLFDLERRLPSRHAIMVDLRKHRASLDDAYLALLKIDRDLRGQAELEARLLEGHSDALGGIVSARGEVIEKLRTQYGRLIREVAGLVGSEQRYLDEISEVRKFLSKELFWMRSSPPVGLDTLMEMPAGLMWLCGPRNRAEFREALGSVFRQQPVGSTVIVLTALLIMLRRRVILGLIKETGLATRRIGTDRFSLTIKALFWSIVLSVPIPLLLGFTGWALGRQPDPSSWLQGLAHGFRDLTWIALTLSFVAAICHKKGLGVGHFRWPGRPLRQLRRAVMWFSVVYFPTFLLVSSCLYGEASSYFNNAGRIAFMFGLVWTVGVYWRFLSRSAMRSSGKREGSARHLVPRWGRWLFLLAVVAPLTLVVLSWLGYLFTAIELNQIFIATVAVVVTGILLYWFTLRWFMIRIRRLTLAEILQRRRERQKAASQEQEGEPEEERPGEEEAQKLDVNAIGTQTRHLLRLLCTTGTFIAIGILWSQIFPVFAILDSVALIGSLTLFALAKTVLIVVVTTVATHNAPGLIRVVALRTSKMAPGTRTALTTLCQYALVGIGVAWVFEVLDFGWSRFGWIATALSVGLGFGLQEVVANFVCGLVLLFERPIRVGDYVTVEGMTGRVTRIRMRATTIVNWDHQEFVVPNKNFITGTLLNWTLQDMTTRIVVTVGVAYGSDTDRAQEVLLEVGRAHPLVLEVPPPLATFEEFAESSLTLCLKVHISHVDKRIQCLSELHSAIKKRFEAEGIEIAFPQRDLHLRTPGAWGPLLGAPGTPTEESS